jgi:hypothetical protein
MSKRSGDIVLGQRVNSRQRNIELMDSGTMLNYTENNLTEA